MGMDRNTVIGFVLLAILLFLYLFISSKNSQELAQQRRLYEDSLAKANLDKQTVPRPATDTAKTATIQPDTTGFNKAINGTEQMVTVENDLMKIEFTSKGGQPKAVYLKKYQSYDSLPVQLISAADKMSYPVNIAP